MKKIIYTIVSIFLSISSVNTYASLTLDGTRYVFLSNERDISIAVKNNTSSMMGGQIWIDNYNKNDKNHYLIASPPYFKIGTDNTQIIRIMKVNNQLPMNQETLFLLNLQDIPLQTKMNKNQLVIALKTVVKIFYRPEKLQKERINAESKIQAILKNNMLILKNPTGYYFSVIQVKYGPVILKNKNMTKFKPFSSLNFNDVKRGKDNVIILLAIDDYGAVNEFKIKII